MITVEGDDRAMRDMERSLARERLAQARAEFLRAAAVASAQFVQASFDRGNDPDGRPWVPLQARRGSPLVLSGRLRRSVRIQVRARSFVVRSVLRYAALQNDGGELPRRVNRHDHTGRFLSKRRAVGLYRSGDRVSITGGATIPARPFFPGNRLPGAWEGRFTTLARDIYARRLGW